MTLDQKAREVAIKAHGDQTYGDQPYITHLEATVEVLLKHKLDGELWVAAGYLHDILEDTRYSYPELVIEFGAWISTKVLAVSKPPKHMTENRKHANYIMYSQIMEIPESCFLKMADRIANVQSGAKNDMYVKEHGYFMDVMSFCRASDRISKHDYWLSVWESMAKELEELIS